MKKIKNSCNFKKNFYITLKGYMYILECSDGTFYAGSTNDLELRLHQYQNVEGAKYTMKRLPVKLVYSEFYQRIDWAFYREKQVQGWSRKKKKALINGKPEFLFELSIAYSDKKGFTVSSRVSATVNTPQSLETSDTVKTQQCFSDSGTEDIKNIVFTGVETPMGTKALKVPAKKH